MPHCFLVAEVSIHVCTLYPCPVYLLASQWPWDSRKHLCPSYPLWPPSTTHPRASRTGQCPRKALFSQQNHTRPVHGGATRGARRMGQQWSHPARGLQTPGPGSAVLEANVCSRCLPRVRSKQPAGHPASQRKPVQREPPNQLLKVWQAWEAQLISAKGPRCLSGLQDHFMRRSL